MRACVLVCARVRACVLVCARVLVCVYDKISATATTRVARVDQQTEAAACVPGSGCGRHVDDRLLSSC